MSETVRVTVPVSREVLDTFKRLAAASGMSTGRAMGDWLGDTLEAAEYMADTLERARAAPRLVMQEIHAYALGLGDETGALLEKVREASRGRTPPSNTGVTFSPAITPKRGKPMISNGKRGGSRAKD